AICLAVPASPLSAVLSMTRAVSAAAPVPAASRSAIRTGSASASSDLAAASTVSMGRRTRARRGLADGGGFAGAPPPDALDSSLGLPFTLLIVTGPEVVGGPRRRPPRSGGAGLWGIHSKMGGLRRRP